MNTPVICNEYKKYCTELEYFREVVGTTRNEDGPVKRKTMHMLLQYQDCNRSFVKQQKGGYSAMGSHVVMKHTSVP